LKPSRSWILVAVVLGSGIVFLDSTIVTVALPQIGRDLSSRFLDVLEGQNYIYYAYLLTLSSLLILAGALSDRFGRRRMFTLGLIGFGVTSILCGIAPTLEVLIVARVFQGAAGALLVPGSLAIISASIPDDQQGRAFGVWAGASAATTIFGPAVGGFFVAYVSWRAAFLINVPLVAIAIYAASRHVPESLDENAPDRFHWSGAIAVALAVGGLTYGAIRGEAQSWEDPSAFVALAIGGVATLALPFLMLRSTHPLVPPWLFRSRNFTVTNLSTLLIYGALYVTFQYFALMAIGTLGYNELAFGIASIPGTLFLALFSARFGGLATRLGPRVFMTVGPFIMGLGILWFARLPSSSEPWQLAFDDASTWVPPSGYLVDILPALLLFGIGLMIMVAPLTTALMRSVDVEHSGVASAINNAISRVGPQLLGAVLFIAVTATFHASLQSQVQANLAASTEIEGSGDVSPMNPPPPGTPAALQGAIQNASTDAFRLAMLVAAGLCFAGAFINGVGIRNEDLRAEHEPEVSTSR
jgi:EmrB/QacA subfamily drug resistance transporter